jgi:hypothetical protein
VPIYRQYAVPAKVLRASQAQRERDLVFDAAQFLCRKETWSIDTRDLKQTRKSPVQRINNKCDALPYSLRLWREWYEFATEC